MTQTAKTKQTKSTTRAKTLKRETPEERAKREARNAYVRAWRAQDKTKKRGAPAPTERALWEPRVVDAPKFLAEPQRIEHEAQPVSALATSLRISDTIDLGDVRSALKVLIQTHRGDASEHTRGKVEGLRMALSMLG